MIHLLLIMFAVVLAYEFESSHDSIIDDFKQSLEENRRWHKLDWAYLICMAAPIAYGYNPWTDISESMTFWVILVYVMCARIIYFNIRLNMKNNKKNLIYLGDAGWDGFWKRLVGESTYYTIFLVLWIASSAYLLYTL